jgi:hypothetical protein
VSNFASNWVRRLWPAEHAIVDRIENDDVRELPEEVPVTSRLRDRPHEWVTFRWPCWPLSWPRQARSRRRSH